MCGREGKATKFLSVFVCKQRQHFHFFICPHVREVNRNFYIMSVFHSDSFLCLLLFFSFIIRYFTSLHIFLGCHQLPSSLKWLLPNSSLMGLPSYLYLHILQSFFLTATEYFCQPHFMDWDIISYILFATAIVKKEEAFGCPQLCLQYCGYLIFQVQGGDDNC